MSENLKNISESIDAVRLQLDDECLSTCQGECSARLDVLLSQIADELRSIGRDQGWSGRLANLHKMIEGKLT